MHASSPLRPILDTKNDGLVGKRKLPSALSLMGHLKHAGKYGTRCIDKQAANAEAGQAGRGVWFFLGATHPQQPILFMCVVSLGADHLTWNKLRMCRNVFAVGILREMPAVIDAREHFAAHKPV